MHITYKTEIVTKKVIDKDIRSLIEEKMSTADLIVGLIDQCDAKIKKLRDEQAKINEITVKFVKFAEKGSVVAFNDDYVNYLDLFIRDEEEKAQLDGVRENKALVESLKKNRADYLEQMRLYEKCDNVAGVFLEDIVKLKNELIQMDLQGPQYKNILNEIEKNKANIVERCEESVKFEASKNATTLRAKWTQALKS